uniref:Alpha/beta hydrolase n=1 Tax=viral metagenome TaxID=1070528 RepID=A0A6C0HA31_9ZZZZ
MTTHSFYKINEIKTDTLFVSFSGYGKDYGSLPRFEFVNFFTKHFNEINRHFYVDTYLSCYHKGICGISNNIDETVEYLRNEIKDYKNVVFLGDSGGGYAAILFGSLLNVTSVVATRPLTIRYDKDIDEKYRDISKYINTTTKYYIYGDLSVSNKKDPHHISHCLRISKYPNVFITKKDRIDLKKMRDSGELYKILYSVSL